MAKIAVFGTCHEIQGCERGPLKIEDSDYPTALRRVISSEGINFIFEEAAGLGPSIAQNLESELKLGGYCDVDPSREERAALGIPEDTSDSWPVDLLGGSRETLHWQDVYAHEMREELWTRKISTCEFSSGLLICGMAHGLSIANRLNAVGFEVKAVFYEPRCKICDGLRQLGLA